MLTVILGLVFDFQDEKECPGQPEKRGDIEIQPGIVFPEEGASERGSRDDHVADKVITAESGSFGGNGCQFEDQGLAGRFAEFL